MEQIPVNWERYPASARPRRRWRWGIGLLGGVVLGLGLAAGGYLWLGRPAASLPDVPLEGAEPAVVQALQAALAEVRRQPASAKAWGELAMLLRACEYAEPAAYCFAQAAARAPTEPRWPYLQGEALLLRGRAEEAVPCLEEALKRAGPAAEAWLLHLRLSEALLVLRQPAAATAHLAQLPAGTPLQPVIELYRGLAALVEGQPAQARQHLLRSLQSPWTRQRACSQLAVACQRLGEATQAEHWQRRAAALPPDGRWPDPWVLECLRRAPGKAARLRYIEQLEAHRRYAEAVAELQQLLQQGPDYKVLIGLGKNHARLGDLEAAEQALRQALTLEPRSVQGHYFLSKILWTKAEQTNDPVRQQALYQEAAAEARQAVDNKPDHALAHLLLGRCCERLGRRDEALAALRQAAACAPELVEPALYLGELLAATGRIAEARRELERARQLAPDDPRPAAALARLP
jgi:tetratricopeptide (TPR) repeat protein